MVDGERIDGVWCHVWLRHPWNGKYFLEDLFLFADGAVKCEDWTDLPGLERSLTSGRVAVTEPGRATPRDDRTKWASRWGEPLTPEGFFVEVADKLEELGGRRTAGERCWDAIRSFQREPDESHRALLRQAFLAVAPHRRIYVLGDMDRQDRPLRILLTDVGTAVDGDGPVVTADMHREVLDYFDRGNQGAADAMERRAVRHADDPVEAGRAALTSCEVVYPQGWPQELGPFVLRSEFPAPVSFAGATYPSVLHGYWALSAADVRDHDRIREAGSGREARELGGPVERRAGWPALRLAVMRGLLEAKFTQHPELAEVLLATGDAVISYTGLSDSAFWLDGFDDRGRNWMGRLLELTRSELVARRAFPG